LSGPDPAMQDLEGGRIDYLCEIITTAKPQIDGGTEKLHGSDDKLNEQLKDDRGASLQAAKSTQVWHGGDIHRNPPFSFLQLKYLRIVWRDDQDIENYRTF
jgi:hypothetical protein